MYSFARRSDSRLVVKVAAHRAGAVSVAVSNPWGTGRRTLTYVAAPKISALSPVDGPGRRREPGHRLRPEPGVVHQGDGRWDVRPVRRHGRAPVILTMPAHPAAVLPLVLSSRFGTSNPMTYTFLDPVPAPASTGRRPGAANVSAGRSPTR